MKSLSADDFLSRLKKLLMTDAAFEGFFVGASEAGGGEDESSLSRLLVCLERELCFEASEGDDLDLDLLERCE